MQVAELEMPRVEGVAASTVGGSQGSAAESIAQVSRKTISWKRKLFHMAGIGTVAAVYGLSTASHPLILAVLLGVTVVFSGADLLRFYVPKLNHMVTRDFGVIMRDYELESLSGSSWFLFAAVLTVGAFSQPAAALAFLCLAFGDPVASWVGVRWGRVRLPGGKSLEGALANSLTCFVLGVPFLLVLSQVGGSTAELAGLSVRSLAVLAGGAAVASAFAEWLPFKKLDDNFTVPLVVGAVGHGLLLSLV